LISRTATGSGCGGWHRCEAVAVNTGHLFVLH
jgi:hypothetical protein